MTIEQIVLNIMFLLSCQTLVYATIRKQSLMQLESSADIFIHEVILVHIHRSIFYFYILQPPLMLDDVSTEGLSADIHVEGDIISKKYDFMMGDLDHNPYKIAQATGYLN